MPKQRTPIGYYGEAVAPYAEANRAIVDMLSATAPSVVVNPVYYHTAAGRDQLRREAQSAGESQLRNAEAELVRQSQTVQEGGHVFSPEELVTRRDLIDASRQSLTAVQPLVSAGLADADTVRRIVGQAATDSVNHQRRVRQATRDANAIMNGYQNGSMTDSQVNKAFDDFEKEYGAAGYQVPAFQEFRGIREQVLSAREDSMESFAASRGLGRRFVMWDEDSNQPTYNAAEFAIEDKKMEWQQRKIKLAAAGADAIGEQTKDIIAVIQQQEKAAGINPDTGKYEPALGAGKADSYLYDQIQILQNARQEAILNMRRELNLAQQPATRREYKQMAPEPNTQAAVHAAATDKPPAPAQNVVYPMFSSKAEVRAAIQAGRLKRNEPFLFNGRKVAVVGNQVVPQ